MHFCFNFVQINQTYKLFQMIEQDEQKRLQEFNKKWVEQRRQKLLKKIPKMSFMQEQHRELELRYKGYMQLHRRKNRTQNGQLSEYFTSAFLSSLKDKRNLSFSDEIIEKALKQYKFKQYQSNLAPNLNFSSNQYYEGLQQRMQGR